MLDNAVAADQVRPLLPGGASCFVIVTSRSTLSGLAADVGAHRLNLGPLTDDEALALLRSRTGSADLAAEPAARLVEHCARLPLALRVAAERLRSPHERRASSVGSSTSWTRTRDPWTCSRPETTTPRSAGCCPGRTDS